MEVPLEVVIPYETFLEFIEEYGLDLSQEEGEALNEAKKDIAGKKWENYTSSEELKMLQTT